MSWLPAAAAVSTAETTAAAESAEAMRSAKEGKHSAAREGTVGTRGGLKRSALPGYEAPRRPCLRRSATEAWKAADAWRCGPAPELGAGPGRLGKRSRLGL
jgi:hypothetical protein